MRKNPGKRSVRRRGFTLIEMLVVLLMLATLMMIGIPILRTTVEKAQIFAFGNDIQSIFQRARFEAIKQGFPTVVQVLPDDRMLRAYIDLPVLDANGARTDTPLAYEPVAGAHALETDRVLFETPLPKVVRLEAPGAQDVVEGMTNISGGDPGDADIAEKVAVFLPNGSVSDLGTFRFSDGGRNFLQTEIEFATSGKSTLLKYDCTSGVWRYRDETVAGRKAWEWYSKSGDC